MFPPLVISRNVLRPQLPMPLWGGVLSTGAALFLRHSGSWGNSPFGDSLLEGCSHFIRATTLPCAVITAGYTSPFVGGREGNRRIWLLEKLWSVMKNILRTEKETLK